MSDATMKDTRPVRARALISERAGPPETLVLGEMEVPPPGKGELRIRVQACGINYPDVLMIEDKYQFPAPRPFVPGIEIAGIVDAVGEGVTDFAVGTPVVAQTDRGGLAEYAIARAISSYGLSDNGAPEIAASVLLTYATSFHALRDRAALQAGETLLVLGAAGGVGLAAIDLGKAMGARVIAAVSSEDKAAAVRAAGADAVLIYPSSGVDGRALAEQMKALAPEGFDVVYDPVGGDYAELAIRRMAWNGRYLVVGFAAGIAKLPLNLVLLKGCQIVGVFWGAHAARDTQAARALVIELFQMIEKKTIKPLTPHLFPLERAHEAIAMLRDRTAIGKLVVRF